MSYLLDMLYYMNINGDFDNDNEFERAKEKGDIIREGYYWINIITGEKFDTAEIFILRLDATINK